MLLRICRILVVLLSALVLFSCCSLAKWRYGQVPDKLETVAIMGFGDHSKCVIPNRERALRLSAKEEQAFWVRLVFADRLGKPVAGKSVKLSVVNAFGEVTEGLTVVPTTVISKDDGFERESITLKADNIGVYRIKAEYADKNSQAVSYSPAIIVSGQ